MKSSKLCALAMLVFIIAILSVMLFGFNPIAQIVFRICMPIVIFLLILATISNSKEYKDLWKYGKV